MKYCAEVVGLKSNTEGVEVEVTNVRPVHAAHWRGWRGPLTFIVPDGQSRCFSIGRSVVLTLAPKREPRRTTGKGSAR